MRLIKVIKNQKFASFVGIFKSSKLYMYGQFNENACCKLRGVFCNAVIM